MIVEWERILRDARWKVEYHWVLSHSAIECNDKADDIAKKAACAHIACRIGLLTFAEQFTFVPLLLFCLSM
jgi:ribonuclease HI